MSAVDYSLLGQVRPFVMPSWADAQQRGFQLRGLARQEDAATATLADEAVVRQALDWGTDHHTGAVDYSKAAQWAAQYGQRPDLADQLHQEAVQRATAATGGAGRYGFAPGIGIYDQTSGAVTRDLPAASGAAPAAARWGEPKPNRLGHMYQTNLGTGATRLTGEDVYAPPRLTVDGTGAVVPVVAGGHVAPKGRPVRLGGVAPAHGLGGRVPLGGVPQPPAMNPDGSLTYTGRMTEQQGNALAFGMRASNMDHLLTTLEQPGQAPVTSRWYRTLDAMPDAATNWMLPEPLQEYNAAKHNFITAVLRKESGAAISGTEFAKEEKKYFPQVGDKPGTIRQKQAARRLAIKTLALQAGRPLPPPDAASEPGGGAPAAPTAPGPGGTPATMTMADVQTTARASGKTVTQVLTAAKAQGIRVTR